MLRDERADGEGIDPSRLEAMTQGFRFVSTDTPSDDDERPLESILAGPEASPETQVLHTSLGQTPRVGARAAAAARGLHRPPALRPGQRRLADARGDQRPPRRQPRAGPPAREPRPRQAARGVQRARPARVPELNVVRCPLTVVVAVAPTDNGQRTTSSASVQRGVHRGDQLGDADLPVGVGVEGACTPRARARRARC